MVTFCNKIIFRFNFKSKIFRYNDSVMKLFVFDIDGTLIHNRKIELEEKLKNKLNEILKRGDVVAIASGRPYAGIIQIFNQLDEGKKYLLCANGSLVTDINGNVLYKCGIKIKEYYDFVLNHPKIFKNRASNIYCYTNHHIGYLKRNFWISAEEKHNGDFKGINLKKNPLPDDYEILKFMIASLPRRSKNFDEKEITDEEKAKFNIVRTSDFFVEFINKNSDKACGVEFLKDYLKIDEKDIYTFGDSGNDVGMLKRFNGVAMGNASIECKEVAKFVTKNVDEDGILYAFEHFVK